MSGFDNEVLYASGERLERSTTQAIALMQKTATDVSIINFTGNPEGLVAANPASLCHVPSTGAVYRKATGTGNTGWVLGTETNLTPDTGGQILPVSGNINVFGQPSLSAQAMETLNVANDLMVECRTWVTPYVVDATTTTGERGTFTTIQSAIDACFADGKASQLGYIEIRKGTYVENLSFPAGNFFIHAPTPNNSVGINNNVVIIQGGHTLADSGSLIAQNIRFTNGFVNPSFNFTGTPSFASFYSCQISASLASPMQLTFNDCTVDNVGMTFSDGAVYAFDTQFGSLTLSGGSQSFYRCAIGAGVVLSNAVAPVCRYCILGNSSTWTGTTSGTPEFYDCITEAKFNYTGIIRVGGLSQGLLTTGDFFGSNITENLTRSTQGNVLIRRTVAISSTVANTDYYIGVTSTAAARTITLPHSSTTNLKPYKGQCFKVKDESGAAGTNNITVAPNGGNIDGAANYVINTNYGFVEVMFDGTNYFKIS